MRTVQRKTFPWRSKPHQSGSTQVDVFASTVLVTTLVVDVQVWDVVAELVKICTAPCPPNPFSVDLDYFASLPASERVLASAAMVNLLQLILSTGSHSYDRRGINCSTDCIVLYSLPLCYAVTNDLASVAQIHFRALLEVVQEKSLGPGSNHKPNSTQPHAIS